MALSDIFAKTIKAGFVTGMSEKWRPASLEMLARDILNEKRDHFDVYALTDLSQPTRNAALAFETMSAYKLSITELANWNKGFTYTSEDKDRLPEIVQAGSMLPMLFGRAKDDYAMTLLVEGDTTTYTLPDQDDMWGGSGVTFFSGTGAGHIYTGGALYTTAMLNLLQKAQVTALTVAVPASPTAAEFRTALDAVWQYVSANIKDTAGANLFTGDEPLDLMVPPNMYFAALEAFTAALQTNGGTNVYINALRGGKIKSDSRLTDTAIWYLMPRLPAGRNGVLEKPLWHVRGKVGGSEVEVVATDERSSEYVNNAPGRYNIRASIYSDVFYGDWRLAYRCVFST